MAALSFNVHSATTFKRTSHPYLSLFIIVTHHSLLITLSRCTWPQPSKELLFIIVTHHSQSLISSYTLLFIIITHIFQGFPSNQTWNLSKNLHRRILRLKILHRQFHLISTVLVGKNTKNEWKWRNLLRWQKFYTAAGTDSMDKFHLCIYFNISTIITSLPSQRSILIKGEQQRKDHVTWCRNGQEVLTKPLTQLQNLNFEFWKTKWHNFRKTARFCHNPQHHPITHAQTGQRRSIWQRHWWLMAWTKRDLFFSFLS